MTGLYDKPCLIRKMDEMIRSGRQFHLIMVDVYQLSHINKVAGIRGGDRLLQELAERMQLLAGAGRSGRQASTLCCWQSPWRSMNGF